MTQGQMPTSSMQDMYNQSPSGAMSSLGMGPRQQFPYGASYDRRWVFPKMKMRWLIRHCAFRNRNWGEGPCPQATSTAVFLLANARKHKLEICQGWAGQGTSLLPKIARAKVVPGTLSTPRPPPQGPCVTPAVTSVPAFLPTGRGLGSGATLGCQQARQQWVLGNVFQALFFQVFPLSPEDVLNWEGVLCSLINISDKSQGNLFFPRDIPLILKWQVRMHYWSRLF